MPNRSMIVLAFLTAVSAVTVAPWAAASATPASQAIPVARASAPAGTGSGTHVFHTRHRPLTASARYAAGGTAVVGGVPMGTTRTRTHLSVAAAITRADAGDTLTAGVSPSTIENYWYWAYGVNFTASGLFAYTSAVITDRAPDGTVRTFDPVESDVNGTVSVHLKSDVYLPQIGTHELTITSADGQVGHAALTITKYAPDRATVTATPTTLTRQKWKATGVVVTGRGFAPHERMQVHVFAPDGTGQQVGAGQGLRADADGVFRYRLQGATVDTETGTWEIVLLNQSQDNTGSVDVTVTEGRRSVPRGHVSITPARATSAQFETIGETYHLTGGTPFDVVTLSLTNPRGITYYIGTYRLSGSGRMSDTVTSSWGVDPGTFRLSFTSINTGDFTGASFVITDAAGHPGTPTTISLAPKRITRLDLIDPDKGVRIELAGFDPGKVAYAIIVDPNWNVMDASNTTITASTVGSDGRLTFQFHSRGVARPGSYRVIAQEDNGGAPIRISAPLTVLR